MRSSGASCCKCSGGTRAVPWNAGLPPLAQDPWPSELQRTLQGAQGRACRGALALQAQLVVSQGRDPRVCRAGAAPLQCRAAWTVLRCERNARDVQQQVAGQSERCQLGYGQTQRRGRQV